MMARWTTVLCAATLAVGLGGAARASSYGGYDCDGLWQARNQIYKDAGLCFRTAAAIRFFGNAGCRYDDPGALPLSPAQQQEIDAIVAVERHKGCR